MFYSEKKKYGEFSQWYRDLENPSKTQFTCPETGIEFNCAEQRMMYQKALLFKDTEIAAEILKASHPMEQKKLGRQVRGFEKDVREREDERIVTEGGYLKYTQNKNLFDVLASTQGTILVEASPHDNIRGIGLRASDPRARDINQRQGKNKLGYSLTKLRDSLLSS